MSSRTIDMMANLMKSERDSIMHRLVPLLIFTATLFFPVVAWSDKGARATSPVEIGANLGLILATFGGEVDSTDTAERQYSLGPFASLALGYRITEIVALRTELSFATKGNRTDTGLAGSSFESTYDYIEIPLLVSAVVPISKQVTPYVLAGPAFSFMIDADATFDDGRSFEINDNVEKFDVGLMAGIGAGLAPGQGNGTIVIEARYNYGLLNTSASSTSDSEDVFNRAFYIIAGYRADLSTIGRLLSGGS